MIVISLPAIRVLLSRTMPGVFGGSEATKSASMPMGFDSSHRGNGYVKSKSNQWTSLNSRDRTRMDDESEVELATRVEISAQPSPLARSHGNVGGSILSSFSGKAG